MWRHLVVLVAMSLGVVLVLAATIDHDIRMALAQRDNPSPASRRSPAADPESNPEPLPAPLPNPDADPDANPEPLPRPHSRRGYWLGNNYVGYSKLHGAGCFTCPSRNCSRISGYRLHEAVVFSCQAQGPAINGNTKWDYTTRGCYIPDNRVETHGMVWSEGQMPVCAF